MKAQTKKRLLKEELSDLAGKVFKDGPYEYRIYVRTGSLGDDDIISISLFIENTPDYVGGDLYMYAINHVAAVAGEDQIKNSDWMINKVVLESHESLGEMTALILKDNRNVLGLQSYIDLFKKIQSIQDRKIVFEDVKRTLMARERKIRKVLEYMQDNITEVEGTPVSIEYKVTGEIKRHNDTILAPKLTIEVNVAFNTSWNNGQTEMARETIDHIVQSVQNTLEELSPIDFHSYDSIAVRKKRETDPKGFR